MSDCPMTQAIRFLRERAIAFIPRLYDYEEKGGTRVSSAALGVDEHAVIKTLVMEDDQRQPLVVLMHGDFEVSTKALARLLGVKAIVPCTPKVAEKHSGYVVGGTSPFGLKTKLAIYAEKSLFVLERIYINGGKRGFLVEIAPAALREVNATDVEVGIARDG